MTSEEEIATAQIPGNTKPGICKKRNFQLTLNFEQNENIEESKNILLSKYNNVLSYLKSLKYTYILSCLETNEKGYYHIHIFIQFNSPHKLLIKKLEGAHIEECKGSVNQNIKYIKKDGHILDEFGYPKFIQGNPHINDIIQSKNKDIFKEIDFRFYRICKEIKKDNPGLFNSKKNIYITSDIKYLDNDKFKNYVFFNPIKGKLKTWSNSYIIEKNYINEITLKALLNKYNKPCLDNFYPSWIENIIFICDDEEEEVKLYDHLYNKYDDAIKKVEHIKDPIVNEYVNSGKIYDEINSDDDNE